MRTDVEIWWDTQGRYFSVDGEDADERPWGKLTSGEQNLLVQVYDSVLGHAYTPEQLELFPHITLRD